MTAIASTAVATREMVRCGKDHCRTFPVKIFAFDERAPQLLFHHLLSHHILKTQSCACARRASRSAKSVLEIVAVKEVVNLAEEAQ